MQRLTRRERIAVAGWCLLGLGLWNGVYDMRMHDTVRGYLLETTRAEAGVGGGVDMRTYLRRGRVDAIAFSSAWALGVFLAGIVTMRTYRRHVIGDAALPIRHR